MAQSRRYPSLPPALHQPRGWMWRILGRAYLRLGGWRIEGAFPEELKFVTIVAPHTSNWDFVVGVALVFALELKVSWLGKHSLFQTPLKRFFLWLGGIPVNRQVPHGVVDTCVKAFEGVPARLLALAPEGTRKGVSQWRSGFYWIATASEVPIWPVGFDFREHVIRMMPVFRPGGDLEADLPRIQALFNQVHGLRERPSEAPTSA